MKEMNEKKAKAVWKNITLYQYMIPVVHFLLTFFSDRFIFIYKDNFEFVNEIARNDYISDKAEMVIVYSLSKLCAGIIIWLMWKIIFGVIKKTIDKKIFILFGIIFLLGLVGGLFYYPNMISISIDNYTNYAMAIRFLPTYWQSVYTGVVYAGSMMVVPHPFGIFLVQWMALVIAIAYIYSGVGRIFPKTNWKFATLLLFLLPETFYVVCDGYRNNYYTILCLFYFGYLIFSLRKSEKQFGKVEMLSMSMVSAFIMVWRSEGILIGVAGMVLLFFVYGIKWKKTIILLSVFVATFLLANFVQGIGEKKYYGQDYMIINTTDVLCSIFNDPNVNLSYDGAEEDLLAIELVVPVQVLKESGSNGYRNYNWTMGRMNFNQTLAEDETAKEYMEAYYRIVANNMITYLDVQTNCFYSALQIGARHNTYAYTGERVMNLEPFQYYRWQIGLEEVRATYQTAEWENNKVRVWVFNIITWLVTVWRELWTTTGLNVLLHSTVIILNVILLCYEVIKFAIYKQKKSLEYAVYFMVLFGEMLAIFLFMPVGRAAYLYPVLYVSYFVIGFYIAEWKEKKARISDGE